MLFSLTLSQCSNVYGWLSVSYHYGFEKLLMFSKLFELVYTSNHIIDGSVLLWHHENKYICTCTTIGGTGKIFIVMNIHYKRKACNEKVRLCTKIIYCNVHHCSDLEVDFGSEENASIVYATIIVDKEVSFEDSAFWFCNSSFSTSFSLFLCLLQLQPGKVKRLMSVSNGKLIVWVVHHFSQCNKCYFLEVMF